ncbi:HAD hydrolase, IA, variant 1 family protein, partial [Vibrio parahaemolyticus V-223/04]
KQG